MPTKKKSTTSKKKKISKKTKTSKKSTNSNKKLESRIDEFATILSPAAMENLYYIAHDAPEALEKRGFRWSGASSKKKKGSKKSKKKKKK